MSKSLNANFSGPFKVGEYENYLSKFAIEMKQIEYIEEKYDFRSREEEGKKVTVYEFIAEGKN